ncbi:MAG: XRE family transcriptional regulator [Bacteroides sp.]|nr:XRE family transcriptional regulator [Bacteroides sp.]
MDIHIGEMIRQELKRQERSIAWLARKLECTRANIYDIFYRKNIDLFLLIRISKILQHNFIEELAEKVEEMGKWKDER